AKWSASWYRMIGLEPDEIPSNYANLCSLMHPDDLSGAQAAIDQCMAGNADTYRAEFRLRHKDGHWVWILSRGRVMERDEQGRPSRFAGTQIDISARKATEALLARRERDLQEILEGTSPVTGEELFECLTLHLARVLGLDYCFVSEPDADNSSGQARMVTLRGPGGMLEPYAYPLAGAASARAFQGESVCCRDDAAGQFPRDGKLLQLGIRGYVAVPLRTGDGKILGVMAGMAKDPLGDLDFVARVFRIFAARAAAELDQRRALAEQRKLEEGIRRAQKMSAVGELAAGVAHDFNNILHVILGNNELLLHERTDDPDLHRTCHAIQQAATRGADLVRQLMCLGRNDAFHPEPHDLNELVAQSLAMLRRGVGPAVDIAFVPEPKSCGAKVDAGQVGQVLLNLSLNARDAMRGKNGHIRIRLRNVELTGGEAELHRLEAGRYVVINVSDTGTGIPAEVQAKIFEPFFTTKEKTQGSGLGLASAYAIMQRHGGAIAFNTVPGEGTTFHLFFPAAALPAQAAPPAAATAGAPAQPLAGRTILVAEDEQMVLNLTARTLRRAGATVLAARDGAEAVDLFRQHAGEVDALLFDAMMPRLNGGQAYLAIRELAPAIPALFASGYSADILNQGALEGLNLEVVQKPCPPGLLVTKLAALLQDQTGKG
ncbi:MAG: PAS domain-containing protein, partial [Lentisphaeria bacterium]|nr:PAS domain-containing protein [Lentisphaeria bacterium]